MLIEDGKGSGRKAEVDSQNRLSVHAKTVQDLENTNEEFGKVFEIPLDAVAPAGANWFFVLQNGGQTEYGIYRIIIATTVAGVYRLSKITGTPVGGTTVLANSLNLGKATIPDALVIQTGTNITGLTEANILKPLYLAANTPYVLDIPSRIYLTPGTGIALKAPSAAVVNGTVALYAEV